MNKNSKINSFYISSTTTQNNYFQHFSQKFFLWGGMGLKKLQTYYKYLSTIFRSFTPKGKSNFKTDKFPCLKYYFYFINIKNKSGESFTLFENLNICQSICC